MERLLALKQPQNDSLVSTSSNLGYETAMDFSICSSNYYSMNDRTLEADNTLDRTQTTVDGMDVDNARSPMCNLSPMHILTPNAQKEAKTSTPLTDNSIAMNHSRLSTNTVKRNLIKIAEVSDHYVDETKDTKAAVDDVLVTSTMDCKSTQTKGSPAAPVPEKENSAPNVVAAKLFSKNLRVSVSNTVRRQSMRSLQLPLQKQGAIPKVIAGTDREKRITRKSVVPQIVVSQASEDEQMHKSLEPITENETSVVSNITTVPPAVIAKPVASIALRRQSKRIASVPLQMIHEAGDPEMHIAKKTNSSTSQVTRPKRISLAPPKPSEPKVPIQRHALRKTIAKVNTPQRRTLRSSLAAAPRAITPLKTKLVRRSTLAKPKTPTPAIRLPLMKIQSPRVARRKTLAVPAKNPIGLPATSKGQVTYTCSVCAKSFLQQSTLNAHQRTHGLGAQKVPLSNENTCRYCDKVFTLPKALSTHLEQNCTKIPSGDRRKLLIAPVSNPDIRVSVAVKRPAALEPSSAHSGMYRTPTRRLKCKQCAKSFMDRNKYMEHVMEHREAE